MATTGDVEITILDGGAAVVVPGASVQVVIGTCSGGIANQIIATQNPNTLQQNMGQGQCPEAAALSCLAGGTVLACKAATVVPGAVLGNAAAPISIVSSTNASPIVVTTLAHGLRTGQVVTIAGHLVNTSAVGTWRIIVLSATTFSLTGSVGVGVGAATGTVQPTGVSQFGSGTSEVTVTGTPNDEYYVKFLVTTGGTVASAGIQFRLSLDAGRHYGPILALGTSLTYAIANTGLTLNFTAGTLVADDYAQFGCSAPTTDTASVIACLAALRDSPYGITGWGSFHLVGAWNASDLATIQAYLETLVTGFYIYTRVMVSGRDASPPVLWGGTGETEVAWIAAVQTDFSAASIKRVCVNEGYYNMASAFPNPVAGSPSYRRALSWALAPRQVTIPPQRHAGRVRDGALSNINVDPTLDPSDGFIYHDDRSKAFDTARFCAARKRQGLPGYYIANPNLMSPLGSVFTLLPLGNVMDVACTIVHQVGQQIINSDIRLNKNGTIYENEALAIQNDLYRNLYEQMIATSEISSATVTVNRTNNILATSTVKVSIVIVARGYVLEEDIEIGFQNPFAAAGAA